MNKNIYTLALGESCESNTNKFLRVPGGWVVTEFNNVNLSSCFVPFNIEFLKITERQ